MRAIRACEIKRVLRIEYTWAEYHELREGPIVRWIDCPR